MSDHDLSPDPESAVERAANASHEFSGQQLRPFSESRYYAAQAMGHRLISGHPLDSDLQGRAVVRLTRGLRRNAPRFSPVALERAATLMRLDQTSVSWLRSGLSARRPLTVRFREVLPYEELGL